MKSLMNTRRLKADLLKISHKLEKVLSGQNLENGQRNRESSQAQALRQNSLSARNYARSYVA